MEKESEKRAVLLLANGMVFEGKSFGAEGCVIGETVFTTGMNGYLETSELKDLSSYIVTASLNDDQVLCNYT